MPRLARIVISEQPHHIVQRGVRSMTVFTSDADREYYLKLLKQNSDKYGLTFLAYCLMNNHMHFVAVPLHQDSLANAIGETHKKGRFFSCPLDNKHTYAAIRYTERNPVRAGLVKNAWDYNWSSAAFHTGIRKNDCLVRKSDLLAEITDWKDFLKQDPDEIKLIRKNLKSGKPCGEENFIQHIENTTGRNLHIRRVGRPFKK